MFNYQIVDLQPGDLLLVSVDVEKYDTDTVNYALKNLQDALPFNKIIANPSEIVNSVQIFRQDNFSTSSKAGEICRKESFFSDSIY